MKVGYVDGKHFTEHVPAVKELRRAGNDEAAASLLLRLIHAVEREASATGRGAFLTPWYYETLAMIYRREKRFDLESALLRRYLLGNQGLGNPPDQVIVQRLEKAQSLEIAAARGGTR